ncbi:MAG: FIST N-terminal domain-containing protein, partial [Candidatus Hadarchaeales archaeon]
PYEAGRRAILEALRDAGRENELPQLILITGSPGVEEEVLRGIDSVTGGKIPVMGGSSADDEIKGEWRQFVNDRVYSRGVSVVAVFTDLKIALGYEAGYERVERAGVVTRAAGRVIYEIENQPAAEVYNAWTGGIISQKLQTGGTVLRETTFWPLAKRRSSNGKEYLISIHPLSVDASDHSLSVFANVESGETLQLMYGSWQILLNRCYSTPAKALQEFSLSPGDGVFALYTYCAGTMLAIPEEHRVKMPLLLRASLGNIPFIGTFTFGEQGYLEGVGNVHGNLVNSIVVFTEVEQPFSR